LATLIRYENGLIDWNSISRANQYINETVVDNTKKASQKAKKLLLENLDDEQKADYEKNSSFTVKTDKDSYKLTATETLRLSDKNRFCAVINGIPVEDQLLVKKLYLENCPDEFFKVANNLTKVSNGNPECHYGDYRYYFDRNIDRYKAQFQYLGFDTNDITLHCGHNNGYSDDYYIRVTYRGHSFQKTLSHGHNYYSNVDEILRLTIERMAEEFSREIIKNFNKRREPVYNFRDRGW
jgi:hypothetical protein